jgi:hypothetical protein
MRVPVSTRQPCGVAATVPDAVPAPCASRSPVNVKVPEIVPPLVHGEVNVSLALNGTEETPAGDGAVWAMAFEISSNMLSAMAVAS